MSEDNPTLVQFDPKRSARYRKTGEVLAFRSDHAFRFEKPWGLQTLPAGSWMVVPLNGGSPTGDIYGCHPDVFDQTYRPSRSKLAHRYEKHTEVRAYQPGVPFAVRTVVAGTGEVECNAAGSSDWIVMNAGGEVYTIRDVVFRATYERIAGDGQAVR